MLDIERGKGFSTFWSLISQSLCKSPLTSITPTFLLAKSIGGFLIFSKLQRCIDREAQAKDDVYSRLPHIHADDKQRDRFSLLLYIAMSCEMLSKNLYVKKKNRSNQRNA